MAEFEKLDALYDLALERSVLGTILTDYVFFQTSSADLSSETFHDETHAKLYTLMRFVYDEDGVFNFERIQAEIRFQKKEDEFDDIFLHELVLEANLINFDSYCKYLISYYLRRQELTLGDFIIASAKDPQLNPYDVYDEILQKLSQISEKASRIKVISALKGGIEYKNMPPIKRKSTGLALIDAAFNGGVFDTDLIVIGARPAMGKTALICSASYNIASQGGKVLIFTLEMTFLQIYMRQIGIHTNNSYSKIAAKKFDDEEKFWSDFDDFQDNISKNIYYIDHSGMNYKQIIQEIKRLSKQIDFDAIYIDYLQKSLEGKNQNIRIDATSAIQAYKTCAKDIKVPHYVLSQLKREVDQRSDPRPMDSDLMESGMIEAESDRVLMLYRPYAYYKKKKCDPKFLVDVINGHEQNTENWGQILIQKDRHDGATGDIWNPFDAQRMYWCDYESQVGGNHKRELNPARFEIAENQNVAPIKKIDNIAPQPPTDDFDDIVEPPF
jgi:replicative DNA helicase